MTPFFLAGIIVIGAITIAVFIKALLQAKDGYEDETGFHLVTPYPAPNRANRTERVEPAVVMTTVPNGSTPVSGGRL